MPTLDAPIQRRACAKLNLTLAVLGKRPDGYHEIESWVAKIDWSDELTFTPAATLEFSIRGDAGGLAADDSNLVVRAAKALADESGHPAAAAITLVKNIPMGAGLGGGSSDAAATLSGLNALWALNWTTDRLQSVAQRIGSDVPLFLDDAVGVVIRGRGERVEPISSPWKGWAAIVVPAYSISTAKVYDSLAADRSDSCAPVKLWLELPPSASLLQKVLFNDLEASALSCEPRLAALLKSLDATGGRRVHMTGSGSCLFAIFDGQEEAEKWRVEARNAAPQPVRIEVIRFL